MRIIVYQRRLLKLDIDIFTFEERKEKYVVPFSRERVSIFQYFLFYYMHIIVLHFFR